MNAGQQLFPILSPFVGGRVFQLIRRETATDKRVPYIVYTPIFSTPETAINGYTGHDWTRVQIDIYGNDYDALDALTNQVITAIDSNIKPSYLTSRQQLYDADGDLFRQSIDYEFPTDLLT